MIKSGKVWGETVHFFGKNNVSIHRIKVKPGGFCSKHCHKYKFNLFYIESGSLIVKVWKNDYDLVDITKLKEQQQMIMPPGEFHQFINESKDYCIVYEIYWTELDESDIIRDSVGGNIE